MNKNNIIILIILVLVIGSLYLFMNHQVNSAEKLLGTTQPLQAEHAVKPFKPQVKEKGGPVKKITYVEVDDGLEEPPADVEQFFGD